LIERGRLPRVKAIGFLADTHSMKNDGSDLPDGVLRAFAKAKVDLIVHLGDIGKKGILPRLGEVAPVLVPVGANKGYVPADRDDEPVKVLATTAGDVGLWFNLAQPDKKITITDDDIEFTGDPFDKLMHRRFKQPVRAVAFAGTHRPMAIEREGVLFVNPGSPTLPMPGTPPAVAVIKVSGKAPSAQIIDVA
jgi:putative phosphoesterase